GGGNLKRSLGLKMPMHVREDGEILRGGDSSLGGFERNRLLPVQMGAYLEEMARCEDFRAFGQRRFARVLPWSDQCASRLFRLNRDRQHPADGAEITAQGKLADTFDVPKRLAP